MLGDLVVGREGATHFPFALNGGEAGADGPDAVDAVGQRRPQIHGLDVGDIAEVTGIVVVRHLDAEPVIGGGSQPQAPLVVERHYEVGVGHPGIIGDVVGRRIQADWPLGGRHPGGALDVDVGAHIDEATGEGHGIETGHGGGVAGEHAGIVGDGGFAGEGAAHAGGGLFGQLKTCRLGLARQHQQGDERRLHDGVHCIVLENEPGVRTFLWLEAGFYMV